MSQDIAYEVDNYEPDREAIKIRKRMLKLVKEIMPKTVLEIGAGVGYLGSEIRELGIEYTGIEPDEEQYKLLKEKFPDLKVLKASCYDDPKELKLRKYDLVISNDVIEHLYYPRKLISFAKECVKPDGKVITCCPFFGSYFKNIFYSIFNKWPSVHSPLWTGGHIKFFNKSQLQSAHAEFGFGNFYYQYINNINYPFFKMSIILICSLLKQK